MAPSISLPSAARARSYIVKLPLFTRVIVLALVGAWVVEVVAGAQWDVKAWGALVPADVGFSSCEFVLGETGAGAQSAGANELRQYTAQTHIHLFTSASSTWS